MSSNGESPSHQHVRRWLEEHGAEVEFTSVALAEIDISESHRNQARISMPLIEDVVMRYAISMEAGDDFPPIVVWRNGSSAIVVDGNQRVAAAEIASRPELDAFEVKNATPALVSTLAKLANANHGLPSSPEDRLSHAVSMAEAGATAEKAARLVGVAVWRVTEALVARRTAQRLVNLHVRNSLGLRPKILARLGSIKNDPALKATAEFVIQAALPGNAVDKLVTDVNSVSSEADALALIAKERELVAEDIAATAGGTVELPGAIKRLRRGIGVLTRIDASDLEGASDDVRDMALKQIDEAIDALREIKKAI